MSEAGEVVTAVAEELEGPLVNRGRAAQEASVVTPPPEGRGPSLEALRSDQRLLHLSEGSSVSTGLQNLLGAEYAETTDRSEEESRSPVSTSVSWAPSKSSMERRWPCLCSDALCPGPSVFAKHSGSAEEAGEGSPVGKQNKDLLLWKDQGRLGGLPAGLAKSCGCRVGRPVWPSPRSEVSIGGCGPLPGVRLCAAALGEGVDPAFCSEAW